GETGILVDGNRPSDTAAAIVRLLDDPEEAARLGKAGREMVLREFDWDRIYEQYRQALAACCG
ncbi:MAG TPA: glycosyltransferase, partial [Actinomycetota bacterium]|nr:glycosyltransferase [Actinomycetota bacterium]